MPKFLTIRTIPSLTDQQLAAGTKRSISLGEPIGVKWLRATIQR
jgi:hypothetical protein